MAFGQQSGPPASSRQIQQLLQLVRDAGHADFRDARGPMGFTQRQAGGRFTRDEAAEFIAQLEGSENHSQRTIGTKSPAMTTAVEQALRRMPAEQMAAELQRRGWIVIPP